MPNWCVGTLKVRGEKGNIKRFILEAFTPIVPVFAGLLGKEQPEKVVEEDKWSIKIKSEKCDGYHVKGTHRNFIDSTEIEWYHDDGILLLDHYRAAWGIDTDALTALSAEYQLDLKIYAFERGMEFNVDFEVHSGNVIKNEEIKFDDYKWECIEPSIGG